MNTFSLKVIASDKVFFDGKCGIIIVPALDGEQAIMSHHEDIDRVRAEAALERAKEQLRQKQSIQEYHVSQASMARAMLRLKEAGKYEVK